MFNIDLVSILLIFIFGVNLLYGLIVYTHNSKDLTNRLFFGVILTVSAWSLSMIAYRGFSDVNWTIMAARLLYVAASGIPLVFLYFTWQFPARTEPFSWWQKWVLPIPFLAIVILSMHPNGLIADVQIQDVGERIIIFNTLAHLIYAIYIVAYFSWAYLVLFFKIYMNTGVVRQQMIFIATGTLISTILGVITNLILPFMGIFDLNWFGQIAIVAMIVLISYAILKHHLFDVKVVATEILTVTLWVVILFRILISQNSEERFVNIIFLVITIVLGAFIVKSVRKEVAQREKIEGLATQLAVANDELNAANAQLKVFDKQKSEFVSIASHQLRSPLTAIKGYVSMLLEGTPSYGDLKAGKITPAGYDALDRVFKSANALVLIIEDLLNISRIEQGRMQYTMADFDLKEMTKEIADNMSIVAAPKGLAVTFIANDDGDYVVSADSGKIRQVIGNIVDNSIKYTPKGSVNISLHHTDESNIVLAVKDTGIGIPANVIPTLFQKFSRAAGAGKVNVMGTGIGLYIAQEIMKAHGGKIWIESPGEGKGSTFFIEFTRRKM